MAAKNKSQSTTSNGEEGVVILLAVRRTYAESMPRSTRHDIEHDVFVALQAAGIYAETRCGFSRYPDNGVGDMRAEVFTDDDFEGVVEAIGVARRRRSRRINALDAAARAGDAA